MFSDTFAGIAPASVPGFIAAQIIGAGLAVVIIRILYPAMTAADAASIVVPHQAPDQRSSAVPPPAGASRGARPAAGTPPERRM